MLNAIPPKQWLTDEGLSPKGRRVRNDLEAFYRYLQDSGLQSYQTARARYFLNRTMYGVLPDGFALPPHTVNVCVNNVCNLACRYCDFGRARKETFYYKYNVVDPERTVELSLDTLKSIVDQAAWFRPIIRASFREPLLHKDILPFIAYTKQAGLDFWLLTNGLALLQNAAALVELGVDSIRVSLDGPRRIHDEICGLKGAHERMIKGVKKLLEERRKAGSPMQVGFYFTLTDDNYNYILETLEELEEEGILAEVFFNFQWLLYTTEKMAAEHNRLHAPLCGGYIHESTVQDVDIQGLDLKLIDEQYRAVRQKYPAAQGWRIHFRPSFELADLQRYLLTEDFPVADPRCLVPWYNLNINPAGKVKSFQHCLLPEVGDIHQHRLLDVWNGESMREQRRNLQEHGAYLGCARCWGLYSQLEDTRRRD